MSTTLDQTAEISRLRNVLRMQRAWIRHWEDDVKSGLPPTRDSLADAADEIDAALKAKETIDA